MTRPSMAGLPPVAFLLLLGCGALVGRVISGMGSLHSYSPNGFAGGTSTCFTRRWDKTSRLWECAQ